jgi:flagellar basal-body rod protein FlgB
MMDKIAEILIVKALDGLALRQQYTAQNIANASTPGYRSVSVNFEDSLRAASLSGNASDIIALRPNVSLESAERAKTGVRLDIELATASQTAMRYGALIEILSRNMALNRAVIAANGR